MLFDVENGEPTISSQAKQIAAFRAVWTRDRDKAKIIALKELAYIYYMVDYRSPYFNMAPEDRHASLYRSLFSDERDPRLDRVRQWQPDEIVKAAMEEYRKLTQTPTMKLLEQTKNAILDSDRLVAISRKRLLSIMEKLEGPIDEEVEDMAKLGMQAVTTFKSIIDIAAAIPEIHQTLNKVEDMIKKEISGSSKIRGGGAINPREI